MSATNEASAATMTTNGDDKQIVEEIQSVSDSRPTENLGANEDNQVNSDINLTLQKNAIKLHPPLGFARVSTGIFRSAYPSSKTLPFIDTLQLRSMICLMPHDLRQELRDYAAQRGIQLRCCPVQHNQDPFLVMSDQNISNIVHFISQPQHQPVLIFCTNGKVRTGCVVACLRRALLGWGVSSVVAEFEQFAEPEGGLCDLFFIESFRYCAPDYIEDSGASAVDVNSGERRAAAVEGCKEGGALAGVAGALAGASSGGQ